MLYFRWLLFFFLLFFPFSLFFLFIPFFPCFLSIKLHLLFHHNNDNDDDNNNHHHHHHYYNVIVTIIITYTPHRAICVGSVGGRGGSRSAVLEKAQAPGSWHLSMSYHHHHLALTHSRSLASSSHSYYFCLSVSPFFVSRAGSLLVLLHFFFIYYKSTLPMSINHDWHW